MQKEDLQKQGVNIIDTKENTNPIINKLKEIDPAIINENGTIDIDTLKSLIGEENIIYNNIAYVLNWVGKDLAKSKYTQKVDKELKFEKEQSKNIDNTDNVVIRGDNLEVLKILKNNYHNKVKCIYIDPPYNTQNENFVYSDNFKQSEKKLIEELDLDEEKIQFYDGLYKAQNHSGWLTFMYPRLKLAKELLTDDGVIFISIDDNEQANLKILMDEIFGEENFVSNIIWKKRKTQANLTKYIAPTHDFILMISKNKENLKVGKLKLREEYVNTMYKNPDNDPRGLWMSKPLASPDNSPNKEFKMDLRNGRKITKKWRCSQNTYDKYLKENLIIIPNNGEGMPRAKIFLKDNEGQIPNTLLIDIATNEQGSKEIEKLLGSNAVFTNPKPVNLIKYLLQISTTPNDIVLDFFAGSGTTGHAVMEQNKEDGGNRKFVLVQWDEKIKKDKPAYQFCVENNFKPVISSITIERLNRAGKKILEENKELEEALDIGYRVYSLQEKRKVNSQLEIENQITRTEDLLANMLVYTGKELSTKFEEVVKDNVYKVDDEYYIINDKFETEVLQDYSHIYLDGYNTKDINKYLQLMPEKDKVSVIL